MILSGGRSARATRAGQYLLKLRLDIQLQLQRRSAKAARPSKGSPLAVGRSSSQPLLACGQPPPSPSRGGHSSSTLDIDQHNCRSTLYRVQHFKWGNAIRLLCKIKREKNRKVVDLRGYARLLTHMRAQVRSYEAARTYKYTLAKSIPSVAKVVRCPPGENGFYLNVMYKHYYYHNYYY